MACATGNDGSAGIPYFPRQDASSGSGGEAGSAGGSPNGGGAGNSQGGSSNGGSSDGGSGGNAGNGGTSTGGSSNGGSSNGGSGGGTGGSCTPPVPGGACDTWPQCGCASGQACYVTDTATGKTGCLSAGTTGKGQACTTLDACVAGTTCIGGACKQFCDKPADCPVSGADCIGVQVSLADGGGASIPGMYSCTDQCDPISTTSCASGMACFPIDDLTVKPGHSLCAEGGTSTTSCSSTVGCKAPYVCLTDNQCHKWCREGNLADCGGLTCSGLSDGVNSGYFYVGNQGYGVCP